MNYAQSQVLLEGLEILIAVQQLVTGSDAECGNHAIDGFSYREAATLQKPEVLCSCNGQPFSESVKDSKCSQLFSCFTKLAIVANSLQHFAQDQARKADLYLPDCIFQPIRLAIQLIIQVVDPHR